MSQLPSDLEMNRVFGLVPFYVLGLMLKPEHFEMLKRRPVARARRAHARPRRSPSPCSWPTGT